MYQRDTSGRLRGAKAEAYARLVRYLDARLTAAGDHGLLIMDGDGSDPTYRTAHRQHLKLATRSLSEDPLFQHSYHSQWVHMAPQERHRRSERGVWAGPVWGGWAGWPPRRPAHPPTAPQPSLSQGTPRPVCGTRCATLRSPAIERNAVVATPPRWGTGPAHAAMTSPHRAEQAKIRRLRPAPGPGQALCDDAD